MKKKGGKISYLTWIAIAMFLVLIIVMFIGFGRDIGDILKNLRFEYLVVALLTYVGVQLAWAIKFFILVKRRVKTAWFPFVALANMYGNFVNITTPSGRMAGEPLRAKMISKRYRTRFSTTFAAAMVDKMTLTLAMIILLIPLTIYMMFEFQMPRLLEYFLGAFVLFWTIVGIVSYMMFKGMGEGRSRRIGDMIFRMSKFILRGKYQKKEFFVNKVKEGILEFKRSFKILSRDPWFMVLDMFLGCLVYGFRFSAAYMFFYAVGHPQPFLTVATVIMISFIIGLISQLPGMVGIGESTMYGLYIATGVIPSVAITVSVLTQMNVYIFEIGFGYLAMVAVNIWSSRPR